MSRELLDFLRARLDDDEQVARAAKPGPWAADGGGVHATHPTDEVVSYTESAEHIARHDPARILREVEVKRRIMEKHGASDRMEYSYFLCTGCSDGHPCDTLRLLALPYDDHPECREEWRPTP